MDKTACTVCGKQIANMDRHMKLVHGQPSEPPTIPDDTFPSASFKMTTESPTKKGEPPKPPKTKHGQLLGFGSFLMTMKDFINSKWENPPYIELDEPTAKGLERQFNEAFGAYITPLLGFCFSMFIVFGLPMLIHAFGNQVIKWWDDFKKGKKSEKKKKEVGDIETKETVD